MQQDSASPDTESNPHWGWLVLTLSVSELCWHNYKHNRCLPASIGAYAGTMESKLQTGKVH